MKRKPVPDGYISRSEIYARLASRGISMNESTFNYYRLIGVFPKGVRCYVDGAPRDFHPQSIVDVIADHVRRRFTVTCPHCGGAVVLHSRKQKGPHVPDDVLTARRDE